MAIVRDRRLKTWIVGLCNALPDVRFISMAVMVERDVALSRSAAELEANESALRRLFAGEGRDTDDIPEFQGLADRHRDLVERVCTTPAKGIAGLTAKARCLRLRDPSTGYDDAVRLGTSLADDMLRIFDRSR